MSQNTNSTASHDSEHSNPPAPLLLDLDHDEISTSTPINATFTTTDMDEKHDTYNNNISNSSTDSDAIPNANSTDDQQSTLPLKDSSVTTSTPTSPHQMNDIAFTDNDSNSNIQTTNEDASNDIHLQQANGTPQPDNVDGEADENQADTQQIDIEASPKTTPPAALDDSSNTENDQSLADDQGEFDFDDGDHNNGLDDFGKSDHDDFAFNNDDDFNDFGNDDDDFGDFGDFDQTGELGVDDDDFGDFGDLPETGPVKDDTRSNEDLPLENATPPEPTLADQYIQLLETDKSNLSSFIESTLAHLWTPVDEPKDDIVSSPASINATLPSSQQNGYDTEELLCTQCSLDLWQKVSRDSVFYNPITGSIGQFQWTRSEINRAYLNALGVRINYEDRLLDNRPTSMTSSPSLQHRLYNQGLQSTSTGSSTTDSASSSPAIPRANDRSTNHLRSNSLTDNLSLANSAAVAALHGGVIAGSSKPPVEEEPELDIDIAKAYCELTEETIRVFPDVKLNAMVVELSRLQRQAKEYLGYLLDQREQLMMDAETYNDLISCIVGHAQRLREQNAAKDASPAMVSKKKKTTGLSGMIKRKNTTGSGTGGTSMGGGVVGVKQSSTSSGSKSTNAGEGRRSL